MVYRVCSTFLLCALAVCSAAAETPATREEALRQQREAKQRGLQPYQPTTLERAMHFVEDRAVFLLGREGFYPKLGSLTTGSGFAMGGGFRDRRVFAYHGTMDIWTAASLKGYWAMEARATFPRLAGGHLLAEAWAGRRDYPEEDFFGIGPGSRRVDRTSYALRGNLFGGRAGVRPVDGLLVGGGLEYLQPRVGPGEDRRLPSIDAVFAPAAAPGLGVRTDYLRTNAFVEVDYREPIYARRGGWYRLDFSRFDDRDAGRFTFNRMEADLRQYIGFLADRRVIALRGFVSTTSADDGQQVPFYYMPVLGGHDTLRGFREYRFRGPHALLLQAEYRWEVWSGLDAALFYDTGKVTDRRSDLDFDGLEQDYGFGFRFNTANGVVLRVDAGFGSREGKHLYIVFGGLF